MSLKLTSTASQWWNPKANMMIKADKILSVGLFSGYNHSSIMLHVYVGEGDKREIPFASLEEANAALSQIGLFLVEE